MDFDGACAQMMAQCDCHNVHIDSVEDSREICACATVNAHRICGDIGSDDGCAIRFGTTCNSCAFDGTTMEDCSNTAEDAQEGSFAPARQSIELTEGGGHFEISGSENMCSHSSAADIANSSANFLSGEAAATAVNIDNAITIPSKLHFEFESGAGAGVDTMALAHLV